MNANEPREQGTGGWSQFGATPPAAGGFPRRDTIAMEVPPPPPPPPPAKHGLTVAQKAVAGLALAAMAVGGGVVGAVVATSFQSEPVASSSPSAPSPVFKSAADQLTVAEVAAKVQPSVVMIQGQSGEGSGVVLSEDGLILTNNHVVVGAGQGGQMTVKFSDGKTAKATVVGTDPATDLGVIRAEGVSGLTKATLGDSDQLKVGDPVLAIGSPLGLDGSVTAGIVSALDRTLNLGDDQPQVPPGWGQQQQQQSAPTTIGGAIQTDASINPGNSGGALVNAAGQLIGINTAIASQAQGGGVGFAIPVNTAKQVADQLISTGKVTHAFLGVSVTDATGDVPGALIRQVTAGSPAEQAGLKEGDLITKIGDKAVDGGDTVVGQVRGFKPGQEVKITYMRDGATHEVGVTLSENK
ncbi:S1C family serine protease [Nonomuraea gerenzanensis]|uniref:HtrA protease/chaperone protein n=1 Tax=Nonomuraea gerenzanensis TaxID=93944 RepID=A0A1M4E844_9ACTN|nr:trypsin-like peptidase domain-containing protein [Nonomuraea gerenzanensis]UBU17245.1 trypsin-like peptidase domain-containing protein [Nonomuraea gerenzanensis]SBO94986.1 HtrA protease/chaperone protein [Nonomuraea gerenzanensis]